MQSVNLQVPFSVSSASSVVQEFTAAVFIKDTRQLFLRTDRYRCDKLYSSELLNVESMASPTTTRNGAMVVSALRVRSHFGKLLRRVEDERRSLVIEKRGVPKAIMISIREYIKLAAPEPEVLTLIGRESERSGTSKLGADKIDRMIKVARSQRPKR
jgi:prevent-host-death family protein